MDAAPQDASLWQNKRQERLQHKRIGKRFNRWNLVLWAAYLLVAAACWGILAIYGPVFGAEVSYQLKSRAGKDGRILGGLVPNLSLTLVPPTIATGYGIVIPKIFVAEPVITNVDPNDKTSYRDALNRGIALAAGTALPGDGGLGYYFAHSSGMNILDPQKQATFYLLGKLNIGDEVDIYREKLKYQYRVVEKQITTPTDLSFLSRQSDKEQIVLQTCWPIGTSLQRLLIFAERV